MKLYVIAPDYKRFREWCWERRIPVDHACYVKDAFALRGITLKAHQLAFVPGWGSRPDALAIDEQVARITGASMVAAQ